MKQSMRDDDRAPWSVRLGRRVLTALLALFVVACGGSDGGLTAGWSVATRLEPRAGMSKALAVGYLDGVVPTVAWTNHIGSGPQEIIVQRRAARGNWVDALPRVSLGANTFQSWPRLAIDASGHAVVTWVENAGPSLLPEVRAVTYDGSASWSPIVVPAPSLSLPTAVWAVADGRGAFWLVVQELIGGGASRNSALRWAPDTGWGAPETLNLSERSVVTHVVSDGQGRLFVLSIDPGATAGDDQSLVLSRFEPDQGWSAQVVDRYPRIDVTGDLREVQAFAGNVWVAWQRYSPIGGIDSMAFRGDVFATRCPVASPCEPAVQRNPVGGPSASNAILSAAANGVVAIGWSAHDSGPSRLHAQTYYLAAGWGPEQEIAAGLEPGVSPMRLVVTPQGDAVAAFPALIGLRNVPFAARYSGGTWSAPRPIAEVGDASPYDIDLAAARSGEVIAVWSQPDGVWGSTDPGVLYVSTFRP